MTFASKTGCVVISTFEGMFDRKGMPIFTSRIVCFVRSGRSSKSRLPPSTLMLLIENRSGFSDDFGFDASSRRSWTLYVPSSLRVSETDGRTSVMARITGPRFKSETASRLA